MNEGRRTTRRTTFRYVRLFLLFILKIRQKKNDRTEVQSFPSNKNKVSDRPLGYSSAQHSWRRTRPDRRVCRTPKDLLLHDIGRIPGWL